MLDGHHAALIVGYTANRIILMHFLPKPRPTAANDNKLPKGK